MKRLLIFLLFISPAIYGQSELNLNAAAGLSKFDDGENSIPQFSWYFSVGHRINLKKSFFIGSSLLIRHIDIKKRFRKTLYCNENISYDYFIKSKSTYAGFLFTIGLDIGPVWFDVSSGFTYSIQSKRMKEGLKKCVDNQIVDIENKWNNCSYKNSDYGIQLELGYRFTNRMSAFMQFYHGSEVNYYGCMEGIIVQMVLGVKYSLIKKDQRYYNHK